MDDDEHERMEYINEAERMERLNQTQDTKWLELQAENDKLRKIINRAKDELGVPSSDYPAPVANAVQILNEA